MTRKRLCQWIVSIVVVLPFIELSAAEVSKVEYAATRIIQSGSGPFAGEVSSQIYVSGNKERIETQVGSQYMITIVRPDKHVAWLLSPQEKTYQEIAIDNMFSVNHERYFDRSKLKKLGEENIEGIKTIKYKAVSAEGLFAGHIWLSEKSIPLKIEKADDKVSGQSAVSIILRDLRVGLQTPSLFELPQGFKKVP